MVLDGVTNGSGKQSIIDDDDTIAPFPADDLLPRSETRARQFVTELYPNYDGRDVTIGILDTGVDPGIPSLRYMKDGVTPKLIDVIDCTGSGDVDVSEERVAVWAENDDNKTGDGYWKVTGLTGRTLKLCKDWKIMAFPKVKERKLPSSVESANIDEISEHEKGEDAQDQNTKSLTVRLGVKRAYELFPPSLNERVKEERKKDFEAEVDKHVALVHLRKSELENLVTAKGKPTLEQSRELEDLEARLEVLTSKDWHTDDPGPLYDCIVFFDGKDYRAVIDVHETGDIRESLPLTSFAKELQYSTFGTVDQLNYAVNFYENGTVLSIVCDVTPHGTHVASIAASSEPNREGVAPGAKLVSLKIGDTRLEGMETGGSLTRALIEAIRHKCDVVNCSYGEDVVMANTGRFKELVEELVWKHNIVFCGAAGNNGPALSTVIAPGGCISACLGISAYVSPAMIKPMYSIPKVSANEKVKVDVQGLTEEDLPGTTFTWSSAGPTPDGDNGVSLTAPGAAITSVSNWCLQKSTLMNGSSMSSPHAAGCVALLISACKAEGIPVSPARIRRALENTADYIPSLSTVQQGWGMIQVDKAFEYLKFFRNIDTEDIYFEVMVTNRLDTPRGVYLRQYEETSVRQSFSIKVEPQFRWEDKISVSTQRKKIDFELHTSLKSVPWVTVPENFIIMNKGREFTITVDPSGLEPGLHTAKVNGYDSNNPERKVIFSVPITVAKPMPIQRVVQLGTLEFQPAEVKRFFIVPPAGSTWMDVTVTDLRGAAEENDATSRLLVLHTIQLLPHASSKILERHKRLSMVPSQTSVTSIAVEERRTIEVNLSRFWSTVGPTRIELTVKFRSLRPTPDHLQLISGSFGALTRINADLAEETVCPSASLTKWQTPLRPTAALVSPLGERDIFPSHNKEIYQLVLTYDFEQEEKGAFTPRTPALQGMLYESGYESQMMLVFDGDKKFLGICDAKPSSITAPKGCVTVRVQVRHDDPSQLEKLKDMVIWIERKLSKPISLAAYHSKKDLIASQNPFKSRVVRKGSCASVFFSEPTLSQLPSNCKSGDLLVGSMTFGSGDASLPGENKRPGGFVVSYFVGPKSRKVPSEVETTIKEDLRTIEEKMNDAVRDLKIELLKKLTAGEQDTGKFDSLYANLDSEYPANIALKIVRLQYLDSHNNRSKMLSEIVDAAESIIRCLSEDEIALTLGRNGNPEDPESVRRREEIKKTKEHLTEALSRMAMAYASMKTDESMEKFVATMNRLNEWSDINAVLTIERETLAGRLGTVLKLINKMLSNDANDKDFIKSLSRDELLEKRTEIYEKLEYKVFVEYDKRLRVLSSPKSFALF